MILTMKDLWDSLQQDCPPAAFIERFQLWLRDQQKALAVIHLHCEREQQLFIAEADTANDAWEFLAEKYASADLAHVLKVQDTFGKARQKPDQSISSWVSHMKSLANQLRVMGEDIEQNKVAHRILNGVGKEYRSTKASLRASQQLTVDMVSQQLEAAKLEIAEEAEENSFDTKTTYQYNVNPRQVYPGSMHGPTAVAMPTVNAQQHSTYNTLPPPPGPYQQSYASATSHPHSYRSQCNACKQLGHLEASCWIKHPHLKLHWMVERDEWKRRCTIENPNILDVPPPQKALHLATIDAVSFIGLGLSSVDQYAISNSMQVM